GGRSSPAQPQRPREDGERAKRTWRAVSGTFLSLRSATPARLAEPGVADRRASSRRDSRDIAVLRGVPSLTVEKAEPPVTMPFRNVLSAVRDRIFLSGTIDAVDDLSPTLRKIGIVGPQLQDLDHRPGQQIRLHVQDILIRATWARPRD